jgi:hypothetical protein
VVAVLFLFWLSYMLLLVISINFVDVSTLFDDRILAPAAVFMLGVLAICMTAVLRLSRAIPYPRQVTCILVGASVIAGAVKMHVKLGVRISDWRDPAWSCPQTMAACRLLPRSADVCTNGQDGIWYLTGRTVSRLPYKYNPYSGLPEGDYSARLDDLCTRVEQGSATIVFFDQLSRRYMPTRMELEMRLHDVEQVYPDGAVFRAKNLPSNQP